MKKDTYSDLTLAQNINIEALSLLESLQYGLFASHYRGRGVEALGVREYERGDDAKAIDAFVTARLGKIYIKEYAENKQLRLCIVQDISASMTENRNASYSAKLLILAALLGHIPLTLVQFNDNVYYKSTTQTKGNFYLAALDNIANDNIKYSGGSNINKALCKVISMLHERHIIVVISDFCSTGYKEIMQALGMRHDLVAICTRSDFDIINSKCGTIRVRDIETKRFAIFPLKSARFHKEWKAYNDKRLLTWESICNSSRTPSLLIKHNENVGEKMIKFFRDCHK